MNSVFSMAFLLRSAVGACAGLIAAIAWVIVNNHGDVDEVAFVLGGLGWAFSLINAAVACLLLNWSVRPGTAFGIAAVLLLPFPIVQYFAVLDSADGEVVHEIAWYHVGAYLCSGIVVLTLMYRAARTTKAEETGACRLPARLGAAI
jgi:hypothetical protein